MTQRYNMGDIPLALAVFLAHDDYDYNDDPLTISATTLLKPVRQIILANRMPKDTVSVDLRSRMRTKIGSAVHNSIEHAWKIHYFTSMQSLGYPEHIIKRIRINPTDEELLADPKIIPVYMEQRASRKVGKWTVTGKYDFIGEGMVQDYKTASTWSYMNQVNADKQIMQGSLYRWLDPKKITRDVIKIHHIFLDWKAHEVASNPKYPKHDFVTQTLKLLPIFDVDLYVQDKLSDLEEYENAEEPDIPPCGSEDLWRSDPVYKFYKNGDVTAKRSTKNFDTIHDAKRYQAVEAGGAGAIKEVPGTVKACIRCNAFAICSQKDSLIASGDLVLT